jgi:hypothetical protein
MNYLGNRFAIGLSQAGVYLRDHLNMCCEPIVRSSQYEYRNISELKILLVSDTGICGQQDRESSTLSGR